MPTIIGKIGNTIASENKNRIYSKVEIIDYQKNRSFVEFRGDLKAIIDSILPGVNIKAEVYIHGKLTKAGHTYNNIIATSIEKL
ncbi:MAG: hypothetical protein CMC76_12185 [Flavobacteriaceae bacterium]|nr:hypothetical protein [Flavobacteriaceae bacterium]|tara:strand:+ start:8817 stop:9068 length:252 start_codon:yes stop_codon:yes gene_type:complete